MKRYAVEYLVHATVCYDVEAETFEEARAKAEALFGSDDSFGSLCPSIDGDLYLIECENGETKYYM